MAKKNSRRLDRHRIDADRRVLELLSQTFGDVQSAATEIINLEAILNLPKGTEHFVADIHGEHEAFAHIIKNASGNIKRKVTELFGTSMREDDIRQLCSLIYYPRRKLEFIRRKESDLDNYYNIVLHQLVKVLQSVSSKYTRSKVRKSLPKEFAYIIEELLHESPQQEDKHTYYNRIVETILSTGQAEEFIRAICNVIQRLSIDRLHILGDIYDRGPGAHLIMDRLESYRHFDIQWGNHDTLWMGAAAGNLASIANVLRICLRYYNMATLEDGYGINLVPLATFALETYADDDCSVFDPKIPEDRSESGMKSRRLTALMHKAITIIQFKLEAQLSARHPEWKMEGRNLLHRIDFKKGTIKLGEKDYTMLDMNLPTVDPADPYRLSPGEQELVDKLAHSFMVSEKLKRHMELLLSHGSIYTVTNGNLLFHASMPLDADGGLKEVEIQGQKYKGRELLDQINYLMRAAFNRDAPESDREFAKDYYWYLWCGEDSPLFDKAKMATFERYFIAEKQTHAERKGHYYDMRECPETVDMILDDFGVKGSHRHIINGHVPVKAGEGENPIKAGGKLMVIDGGFSKAYHHTTGIAGYTLVFHSRGFELVQHQPFTTTDDAIRNGTDIIGVKQIVELNSQRILVRHTDKGEELQSQIDELHELLQAYRNGLLKERK